MSPTTKKTGAAESATKAPVLRATQVSQPDAQVMKPSEQTPMPFEVMKTSEIVTYVKGKYRESETAHKVFFSRTRELYPALVELEQRYQKLPGQRTDLDDTDFKGLGWHEYLNSIGVVPATFRSWKARLEQKMQNLLEVSEEAVAADSAPAKTSVVIEDTGDDTKAQVKRSEETQRLLIEQREADLREKDDFNEDVAPVETSQPSIASAYTREQANRDAEMRQTTELVGKHVWLARSAHSFVLVLAYDKATAEEIADLNGILPVSCINVNLAETAVIMQGDIHERQGVCFSMEEPSQVDKAIDAEMFETAAQLSEHTDAKKPVQSETTMDELVEAA